MEVTLFLITILDTTLYEFIIKISHFCIKTNTELQNYLLK